MTIKELCADVKNNISSIDYLIVWRDEISWNWYPIFEEDYNIEYDCLCFVFNEHEMKKIKDIIETDNNAVIIHHDFLCDCFTNYSLLKIIQERYKNCADKLPIFYKMCVSNEYYK